MAQLLIQDEKIAWRLLDIARREKRSVESVLESLLEDYEPSTSEDEPQPGTFAALLKAAQEARIGVDSEPTNTSEKSREILNTEYADYLKRRMDEQSNTD